MSLFLGLMVVQKMIEVVLPLSLSHMRFKIGNEDIDIPSSSAAASFVGACCAASSPVA